MPERRNRGSVRVHEDGKNQLIKAKANKSNYEGKIWTYMDIAKASNVAEVTVKRFFRGKNVDKTSAEAIAKALDLNLDDLIDLQLSDTSDTLNTESDVSDAEDIPDVSDFFGRTQELATLKQWIVEDKCRLVTLVGMEGIGKTSLAIKLANEMKSEFNHFIDESLKDFSSLNELLESWLLSLPIQTTNSTSSIENKIGILKTYLKNNRCLFLLRCVEEILQDKELAGKYRPEYENYDQLFNAFAFGSHRSCLVLISSEKPSSIEGLKQRSKKVKSLPVKGLDDLAAKEIFRAKNFSGSEPRLTELIEYYQGNPFILRIVSSLIRQISNGNVAQFLDNYTLVFNNVYSLLDAQYQRLSDLEKEIIRYLAISEEFVSVNELRHQLNKQGTTDALISLMERGLIEKRINGVSYFLQPMVMRFIKRKMQLGI
jgi:transcriptional regulator with XRE-family HTH domain